MSANGNRVDVGQGAATFGRFLLALTITMSAVALASQFGIQNAWLLVSIVLLGMLLTQGDNFNRAIDEIYNFVNNVLGNPIKRG